MGVFYLNSLTCCVLDCGVFSCRWLNSTLAQLKGCLSLNLFGYVCLFQNVTLILSKKEKTHVEVLDGDTKLC